MLLVSHEYVPIPGHWAILVSPDVTKEGTLFNTLGNHFRGFYVDVKKDICPRPGECVSSFILGSVDKPKLARMEEIANSTPEPAPDCQTWAQWFAQRLADEGILHTSAMEKFKTAPRT
ncbi:hypothetical protein B0J15DRAFT_512848 [Fusarium solani]|uniref:Uncharacterized protein n=1 Tax=Fusarium solani TaxID=169388 RepID=A0A9P9HBS8_FUSSL|nr:uncharacterized protein B0J15DRAFT_512848 [Fusarium solani]KAH7254626.1 hypothetical protein B0J15DRAFT_512848 [Fusarium solani]